MIYYLQLGVDKIYIYDNNEINGEKFEDVLQDLIDEKLVYIIDMRGKQDENPRKIAYEKCYKDHYDIYDWFLFFDFDEYLDIGENTLDKFIKLPIYNKCSSVLLYWRLYTDNGKFNYRIPINNPCPPDEPKLAIFLRGDYSKMKYSLFQRNLECNIIK